MTDNLIEKIKSRGYWRINFRPLDFEVEKISPLPKCSELVEKSAVKLRGWDYPHFPRREGITVGNDYVEGAIDFENHKELWRMYQSGQFIHYLALYDDWLDEETAAAEGLNIEPGTVLSITGSVFLITEIFEFLSRLSREGIYTQGVEVKIGLYNTKNRELKVSPGRAPLFGQYSSDIEHIEFSKMYSEKDVIEKPAELALDAILYFFHRFKWSNPPIEVIKNDQQRLLERRW